MPWGFYGRTDELRMTVEIIGRNRWFFVKMTGRRRIGKTTLIQHAIQTAGGKPIFYVQTPDSAPAGVLSAVDDALESFNVSPDRFARPRTLAEFARLIGSLVQAGYIVVLDEFQYFNRAHLLPFCSSLQAEVDTLSAQADRVPGGLIVLGSIRTEMTALLEDRNAPLFNRTTDEIELTHLDIGPCWRSSASTPTHSLSAYYSSGRYLRAFPSSIATVTSKGCSEASEPHYCGGSFLKARRPCAPRPRTGFSRNFAADTTSCSSSSPGTMVACTATYRSTCAK